MSLPFRKTSSFAFILMGVVVGLLVGVMSGAALVPWLRAPILQAFDLGSAFIPPSRLTVPPPVLNQTDGIAEDEQTVAVVQRLEPSVVSVIVKKDLLKERSNRMKEYSDFFEDSSVSGPETAQRIGGGSGFFVSSDGLIATNRHVVEDPKADYSVILQDGKTLPATVVARDPSMDVAILRVEGSGYPAVKFGDSDKLQVGQTVLAIGNALDQFRNTVTKGIVSGLNRRVVAEDDVQAQVLDHVIQTDAAINPGNSGGPLVDLHGNVVGMNTAVSLSGQLLGFALPSSVVTRDVEAVKKTGKITRPFLGVRYLILTPESARRLGLLVDHGAFVSRGSRGNQPAVIHGSPADKAGIQENDIILAVDGVPVDETRDLGSFIDRKSPGDILTLRVLRGGKELDLQVTLQEIQTPSP